MTISPMRKIEDEAWRWHVGLDVESTAILNALYQNTELDDSRLERMLSLFTLTFDNPADAAHDMRERPVYLGLAMTADNRLKLKPQNLLLNLPLAAESA